MGEVRGLSARGQVAQRALLVWSLAAVVGLLAAATASAQAPAPTVLVFHGTPNATVNAGVAAIEALGARQRLRRRRRARTRPTSRPPTSASTGRSSSSATPATRSTRRRRPRSRATSRTAAASSASAAPPRREPGSTFFGNLIGARPAAGSPTGTAEKVVEVGDRVHPATKALPLEWTRAATSGTSGRPRPTGQVHTVARYRAPNAPAGDGTDIGGTDWPISWCRDFQGGRSFYTGMGRTAASYGEADFRTHLLGAIQWSAGMIRAGCKATIAANYEGERLVDGSSGDLAHTGESHGVAIAPNGWAIYIGRGDCRTDAAARRR